MPQPADPLLVENGKSSAETSIEILMRALSDISDPLAALDFLANVRTWANKEEASIRQHEINPNEE